MSGGRDNGVAYYNDGANNMKRAIQFDQQQNFPLAKQYYLKAVSSFKLALGQTLTPKYRENATTSIASCENRVQMIDSMQPAEVVQPSGGGAAQKSKPDAKKPGNKPNGGGGGGGGGGNNANEDENNEFKDRISSAILKEKPDISFEDVAGLATAKRALEEAVILPMRLPKFFTGERAPWRGILLYGPPGTGKSFLAKATAREAGENTTFLTVSTSDLVSKWLGESEKLIRALFDTARQEKHAIIFIDEIDSLLSERSENDSESARRIKTEFLIQMDGVGKSMEGILLLAATNIPWGLDPAVRRRFEKKIYIPLPDYEARRYLIKQKVKKTPHNLVDQDFEQIASMTEGYSGADLKILTREAAMLAVRNLQKAEYFCEYQGMMYACNPDQPGAIKTDLMHIDPDKLQPPPMTAADFIQSISKIRPSVSPKDLTRFEEWTAEFGQEGN